jgi:glutamine synthetase
MTKVPTIVELQFTNLLGELKSIDLEYSRFKEAIKLGKGIDGSSVGLTPVEESDLILKPIMETFFWLPWNRIEAARVLCDIFQPAKNVKEFGKEKEHEYSPRYILKKVLEENRREGYEFITSAEMEFFTLDQGKPLDEAGYFSPPPLDKGTSLRREIMKTLMKVGVQCEYLHHEVSIGQYEVSLKHDSALKTADKIMTFKYVAKNLAAQKGLLLTFMPKPFTGMNGSGMHIHMSLRRGRRNSFYGEGGISSEAKYFIGGILTHAKALAALAAPTVNSYKRLVAGYEAPVYLCWGFMNRSALIRVPSFNSRKAARIELRMPDPKCNPYLVKAGILAAGMHGIRERMNPGEPFTKNAFENAEGMEHLPLTLKDALLELERDKVIVEALGEGAVKKYISLKMREWRDYEKIHPNWTPLEITEWEKNKYLNSF